MTPLEEAIELAQQERIKASRAYAKERDEQLVFVKPLDLGRLAELKAQVSDAIKTTQLLRRALGKD